eukprot:jgi/Mesvir1/8723/Mv26112-RA.1
MSDFLGFGVPPPTALTGFLLDVCNRILLADAPPIPEWQHSYRIMLYKNKGSPDDPANYRGVCIQSAALN